MKPTHTHYHGDGTKTINCDCQHPNIPKRHDPMIEDVHRLIAIANSPPPEPQISQATALELLKAIHGYIGIDGRDGPVRLREAIAKASVELGRKGGEK